MLISEGRFSPGEPARYHGLVDQLWNSDHFLVASDFASYRAAQAEVDRLYARPDAWARSAILNVARMGFFSSDRAIRAYMKEIWSVTPAPNTDQATDG